MLSCVTHWHGKEYDGKIFLGDDVLIREDVQISAAASISIGSGTSVGRNSMILDHFHNLMGIGLPPLAQPLTRPKPVVIEENCYLSAQVMVGPGVRIGKGSVIGFGCVVLRDVPPYSMLVNDPANIVRQYDEEEQCWRTLRFARDRVDQSRKKRRVRPVPDDDRES
jgi:Acetyltransferase (isoleucine patch superfamily)